jgi:hypothetical protein
VVGEAVVVETVQLKLGRPAFREVRGQGMKHRVGLVGDVRCSSGGAAVGACHQQRGVRQLAEQGEADSFGFPV